MKRLMRWLGQHLIKSGVVSDDPYYAWADQRLDELAEEARLTRQMADRGYIYIPKEKR